MIQIKYPIALVTTFIWVGFICAISFMEAWLKFQAPGITVSLGLEIGRLVFGALNKVEWACTIAILASFLISKGSLVSSNNLLYCIPVFLLVLQTVWLLPALDVRAEQYIEGIILPPSYLHFYYIGMEVTKVACLTLFGISLLKNSDERRSTTKGN